MHTPTLNIFFKTSTSTLRYMGCVYIIYVYIYTFHIYSPVYKQGEGKKEKEIKGKQLSVAAAKKFNKSIACCVKGLTRSESFFFPG